MKILVAGGCGFAGSNYIQYVLKNHPTDEVICVDIAAVGDSLKDIENNFQYICADITDVEKIYSIFEKEKPNVVVNYVSLKSRSLEYSEVAKVNIMGTTVLLDACVKYGVDRFHQISSAEVYGELPLGRDMYYTEKSNLRPVSQYGASKAAADLMVMSYHETFHIPVTISRVVNLYGPYQNDARQIPSQIIKAMHDENLDIYGTGADIRDWVHVDDHSRAVDLIIRNGRVGEIYNIGSDNEIRSIYLVRIILNELDKSEDLIVYKENRRGKERRNALDYTKIQRELGWLPQIEFAQGMRDTIAWYEHK